MGLLDVFVVMQPTVSVQGRARIARDGQSITAECLQTASNPGDLVALDEALKLRESGQVSRVTCIAAGASAADSVLSHGMAMGADRVVRIPAADDLYVDAQRLGRSLAAALAGAAARLVFAAGSSTDGEVDALPHVIATALDAACLTNVMALRLSGTEVEVDRWLERGRRETWGARLPAVVAFAGRANTPRYVTVAALALAAQTTSPGLVPPAPPVQAADRDAATTLIRLVTPRIRPKRIAGGSSRQTASERMRAAVSGGVGESHGGKSLSGSPDHVADLIVAFLDERGLLAARR